MKKFLICLMSLVLAVAVWADKRPMTTDDALNMVSLGNTLISPDGKRVFFSKSELNWEKNKRETKYYMIPAEGGKAFQYIGEAGGSSFMFSPDGKYLSLKRTVDKKSQIFLMPTSGGEAVQLTKHKESVASYVWAPDGTKIFFTANKIRPKEEEKKIENGEDIIFVDEGPNGQNAGRWRHLFVCDVKTGAITPVLEEDLLIGGFDVSPDGNRILFTASTSNRRNDGYLSEIWLLDVAEKSKVRLTENKAPERSPVWAPDGKRFAFTAADDKEWRNRNGKIWLMDTESKKPALISGEFEGGIRGFSWSPDGQTIFFNGQQGTNSNLFSLDVDGGGIKKLTDVKGTIMVYGFSKDRSRMVYAFSDYATPADLYSSPVASLQPVRLTDANPWIKTDLLLADMKLLRWKSRDGFVIEGLLHLPAGGGTRLPLILNIHGGPAGCFTNSFRASYHVHAGLGYASLSPNVRGSSGYNDRLQEGNTVSAGDGIGKGDYWDLMNGIDYVIKEGYADPDKLGLRGWSYGGILGGWTITQTGRFKAASIGAGVYDWPSEYGTGFNHDVRLWHIGGTPWDNPDDWEKQSALTHVKNISTPTLIIHGMRDTTDTEAQSMNLFVALKDIGKVPVRYLRAPREPHGFREPRHQRIRDIEEIKWMQKYILGVDWTPWERPAPKKEDEKKEEPAGKKS
jgi:dipeptidyl aminopeptidase/acylaminoacyl peptidase